MIFKEICVFLFLSFCLHCQGLSTPLRYRRQLRHSPSYGITNYEINETVRRLIREVKSVKDKLNRHEAREANLAAFSTKTLNALTADSVRSKEMLQTIAKQLSNMEEKMLTMDVLITTTDERQRSKLDSLGDGLNRLLMNQPKANNDFLPPFIPGGDPAVQAELKKILNKIGGIDDVLKHDVKTVNNEVKIVGEAMKQHMEQLSTQQDRLWTDWNTCQKDQIRSLADVSDSLAQTGNLFVEHVKEAKNLFSKGGAANDCGKIKNEVVKSLNSLDQAYHDQEKELEALNHDTHLALTQQKGDLEALLKESESEKQLLQEHFSGVIGNMNQLETQSKKHLGELETTLKSMIKENTQDLTKRVENISSTLKVKTTNIMTALEDAAGTSENVQQTIVENFEELTNNVRGLKKVEQVMLSTADAVLDTKRSIEFGIQQVILELSAAVKNSGKNINSTLSDQINNISFAILKNQTSALTNMTKKMENEISQVWRQIGIMYQQIAQSVNILGELKTSTSQHMNASLDKVGTMDGTVGAINNKVADVEDNLNYLLGRLSLVTSEFAQMKVGVGSELEKLRDMAKEFSGDKVVEYQVNKKRSIEGANHHRHRNRSYKMYPKA